MLRSRNVYNKLFNDSKRKLMILKELEQKFCQDEEKTCTFSPKINPFRGSFNIGKMQKQNFETINYNTNNYNTNNYNMIDYKMRRRSFFIPNKKDNNYILKQNKKGKNNSRNFESDFFCMMENYYTYKNKVPINYKFHLNQNYNKRFNYILNKNKLIPPSENIYTPKENSTKGIIKYSNNNIINNQNELIYDLDIENGKQIYKNKINECNNNMYCNRLNINDDSKSNEYNYGYDLDSIKSTNRIFQTINNYTLSEQTIPVNYAKRKGKVFMKNYKNKNNISYRKNNKSMTNKNSSSSFANNSMLSKNFIKYNNQTLSVNKEESIQNLINRIPYNLTPYIRKNEKIKKNPLGKLMDINSNHQNNKNVINMKMNVLNKNIINREYRTLINSGRTNYTNNETKGWTASTISIKDGKFNRTKNVSKKKKSCKKYNNNFNSKKSNKNKINKFKYYKDIIVNKDSKLIKINTKIPVEFKLYDEYNSNNEEYFNNKKEIITTLQSISDSKMFDLADHYIKSIPKYNDSIELKKNNFENKLTI